MKLNKLTTKMKVKLAIKKIEKSVDWNIDDEGQVKLWFEVLSLAIQDAFAQVNINSAYHMRMLPQQVNQARMYLTQHMDDMGDCEKIGLSPEYVRLIIKKCGLYLDERL